MTDLSRRSFLKALGGTVAVVALPVGWLTPNRPPRTFVVAAADSPDYIKECADIHCLGYNDDQTINDVIQRGDRIVMTGGTFHIANTLDLSETRNSIVVGNRFIGPGTSEIKLAPETNKRYT